MVLDREETKTRTGRDFDEEWRDENDDGVDNGVNDRENGEGTSGRSCYYPLGGLHGCALHSTTRGRTRPSPSTPEAYFGIRCNEGRVREVHPSELRYMALRVCSSGSMRLGGREELMPKCIVSFIMVSDSFPSRN